MVWVGVTQCLKGGGGGLMIIAPSSAKLKGGTGKSTTEFNTGKMKKISAIGPFPMNILRSVKDISSSWNVVKFIQYVNYSCKKAGVTFFVFGHCCSAHISRLHRIRCTQQFICPSDLFP